jgi:hypothetical protein
VQQQQLAALAGLMHGRNAACFTLASFGPYFIHGLFTASFSFSFTTTTTTTTTSALVTRIFIRIF